MHRSRATPVLLLLCFTAACRVDATVGYDTGELNELACDPDPLARCDQGKCAVTKLFDAPNGAVALAADDEDIFFLTSALGIGQRAIEGGSVVDLAAADTAVMSMACDATHVYWLEFDGTLRGLSKAGGSSFEASHVFGNPTDMTLDATHLYWVYPDSGEVAMVRKPRDEATHISGQNAPQAITTDATHVYWVNAGTEPATGELMRAVRGDLTTAELVLSGLDAPVAVAASDEAVYWASKTALFRWVKAGALVETVATGFSEITRIRARGSTVYGIGMDGLWSLAVNGGERLTLHPRPMSSLAVACSGVFSSHWLEDGLERYGP